ncbi:DUF2946 family protein [Fontimonas sp. SYSU GA230001]|uniref:DUF2946 family protein n=1 Tax=Fontimonas sp. SYSU GA230001 TaxID=3142450 RepID=UPI0032B3981C
MEDWVVRALAKWPNVPAVYGWLGLDRRGRWRLRGEPITRTQIIDAINRNYAADALGCWYFQNGPQRAYVQLEYAPWVLRDDGRGHLVTHTGRAVENLRAAYLDEEGAVLLDTEHGPGLIDGEDLDWVLQRLRLGDRAAGEDELAAALMLPSGALTDLRLQCGARALPVLRLDAADAPGRLGFVRDPQPAAPTVAPRGTAL